VRAERPGGRYARPRSAAWHLVRRAVRVGGPELGRVLRGDGRGRSSLPVSGAAAGRQPVRPGRTLALLTSFLGANVGRHRATSGHIGPQDYRR
jgi:hypothetical protein